MKNDNIVNYIKLNFLQYKKNNLFQHLQISNNHGTNVIYLTANHYFKIIATNHFMIIFQIKFALMLLQEQLLLCLMRSVFSNIVFGFMNP